MTQDRTRSETHRSYVFGNTATRDSVEHALDRAFASVGGDKLEAPKRSNPVPLSPLMQRVVDALCADGGWVKGRDIAHIVGSRTGPVQEAIRLQRARLPDHGFRIESHTKHGYRIVRVGS